MSINYTSLYGQIRTFFREYTAEETTAGIINANKLRDFDKLKYWLKYGKNIRITPQLYHNSFSSALDNDDVGVLDALDYIDEHTFRHAYLDPGLYHQSIAQRKINIFKREFSGKTETMKGIEFSEDDRVFIDQVSDFLHSLGKSYVDFNVHGTGLEVYLRRNEIDVIKRIDILPRDLVGDIAKYY